LGTDRPLPIGGDINGQADWLNQESLRVQAGECQTNGRLNKSIGLSVEVEVEVDFLPLGKI
jgi:hypothetical protein